MKLKNNKTCNIYIYIYIYVENNEIKRNCRKTKKDNKFAFITIIFI